jgi:hypothetical protein
LNGEIRLITPSRIKEIKRGMYFVSEKEGEIKINLIEEDVIIDYLINIKTINEKINIFINGFIKHGKSQIDFYIDETYPGNQVKKVLYGYNIKEIVDKYNELYLQEFNRDDPDDDEQKKNDIDNFLSGKIT